MAPIVDVRQGARTTVFALAMGVALLLISALVAQDLWRSVGEVQVLKSGARCGQAPPPCMAAITVTLEGSFEERRDALVTWWTTDDGGAAGDVRLLPSAEARANLRPGPAAVYVVDGKVVAVGDRHVPTSLAGSHAVFVDSAGGCPNGLGGSAAVAPVATCHDEGPPRGLLSRSIACRTIGVRDTRPQ